MILAPSVETLVRMIDVQVCCKVTARRRKPNRNCLSDTLKERLWGLILPWLLRY